jgi:DNA-binding response OmpR family regulator
MSYILLVEDNQSNADMVIRILQAHNYQIKHYLRGFDGMKAAREARPALVLMDFDLPDTDGRNLVLVMKKQLGKDLPVIAVTARAGKNEEYIAKRFGCDDYISKPFEPQQLLDTVARFLPASTAGK